MPATPLDGTLLVATAPTTFGGSPVPSFTGIVGVDPNLGTQSVVSTGSLFDLPTYITEDLSSGMLYVSDLYSFGSGAIIAVNPNLPSSSNASLITEGSFISGPNALALENGELYVANEGAGSAAGSGRVHYIVEVDPGTHSQLGIVSNGDNGTSTGGNTASTLNDTSTSDLAGPNDTQKPWRPNEWAGWSVKILSGTGAGEFATIVSNTATQLTISGAGPMLPPMPPRPTKSASSFRPAWPPAPATACTLRMNRATSAVIMGACLEGQMLTTGVQTIVSTNGFFNHPTDIALDSGNILVLNTEGTGGLFEVNPSTGGQTLLSSNLGINFADSVEVSETGTIFIGVVQYGPPFFASNTPGSVFDFSSGGTLTSDMNLSEVEGMRTYHAVASAPVATATAISSSSNPSLVGQSVTFTATVTAANGSTPTGSVQFTVNGTALGGPVTLNGSGVAVSTTTTTLPAGHNTVTASYTATGDFQNSSNTLTQTVNASTSTALSSSLNPSLVGQSVTFTATVTANNGTTPTGSVQFAVNGTALGGPVTLNGSGVAVSMADSSLPAGTQRSRPPIAPPASP